VRGAPRHRALQIIYIQYVSGNPDLSSTAELARFAAGVQVADLPPAVLEHTRLLVLDTIACALGGVESEIGQIALRVASGEGGPATLIGASSASPLAAAAANGRLAAALDADDTFPSAGQTSHHGGSVVAAALAFAEAGGASGAELVAAIAAGHELGARLGAAAPVRDPGTIGGWRVGGGAAGVMASAAATGRVLGLDAAQMEHALGIAAARITLPPLKWVGAQVAPMVKSMDIGLSAAVGAEAALLASHGLTGHASVLDGDDGLWRALGYDRFDFAALSGDLGERWNSLDGRFKRWPCQYWMHPALAALTSLLPLDGEVESILLRTNPRSSAARFRDRRPVGAVTCQFNLPHAAAMVVLGVPPGPRWYAPDVLADPRVAALRERVTVELDPRSEAAMGRIERGVIREPPGSAEVRAGGRVLHAAVGAPDGPSWWSMSELGAAELAEKLTLMTGGAPPAGLLDLVAGLERVADVHALGALLRG
jgi:2-methylcitrate dehydratase PrpD